MADLHKQVKDIALPSFIKQFSVGNFGKHQDLIDIKPFVTNAGIYAPCDHTYITSRHYL
jgi:hypothetical protein